MANPKVILFYVFTPLADPEAVRLWQHTLASGLGLRGRVIVSPHGINATVGGEMPAVKRYVRELRGYAPFREADVKWSQGSGLTEEPGPSGFRELLDFPKLSVKVRDELVTFGVPEEVEVGPAGVVGGGVHLTPQALHQLVEERGDDVVFFDGRNAYEAKVGRFDGAVVPDVRTTREFIGQLDEGLYDELKGRPVVTYCTGGIRCEVLTALMKSRGFDDLYQLDGGIARYGEVYGDRGLWRGSMYVFDGRMTVDFSDSPTVIGECVHCSAKTSRMQNCDLGACRMQIVLCEECAAAGRIHCPEHAA
ncbi:MAG: rhodanese-related sulfurtransferase [Solirubrobacteraceae bacterium]|nr:rhodanese-related sulfurtransferase [Solirubrobacteraceae bacterium]